jgi:hypothetical protein
MFISEIDTYFDNILNDFYKFTMKENTFNKVSKDTNFVKYQNDILSTIKKFMDNVNKKEISNIVKSESNVEYILNIIKRYCAFYIYLGIAYTYNGGRDLFITNIIESSKDQKNSDYVINNFYNSENNSKIISMYSIIKNIQELKEFKTIDRIKIILNNNPIKYNTTIDLFNDIGEDYVEKYLIIKDNFHNIVKTFIFKIIYLNEEKREINRILNEIDDDNAEYKYIDVVYGKDEKLIDFTILQSFLTSEEIRKGLAEDYYDYISQYKIDNELNIISTNKIIHFLFSNKILIPITEDFMRYHKSSFKYDKNEDKTRDDTKIKFILNILNKVKNYYSKTYENNPKMKLVIKELFYKQLKGRDAILYNDIEEVNIIQKLMNNPTSTDADYLVDLDNSRKYAYLNFKDMSKDGFRLRTKNAIQGTRYSNIKNKIDLEFRVGHNDLPMNVVGVMFNPSNKNLECFNTEDLKNIHEINKNGYEGFIKIMKEKFDTKDNNLYYWLFNKETDNVVLNEYKNVSTHDTDKFIQSILAEIYPSYLELLTEKIINEINNNKPDIFKLHQIIKNYNNNIISNNLGIDFSKNILNKVIDLIYKEIEINIDDIDKKLDELREKNIKIPVSEFIKKPDETLYLKDKLEEINIEDIKFQPICHHYIKWDKIKKIPRKDSDELNQKVFDFVKQYVRVNELGLYICKSCSETLNLRKYVYEGTYVPELDTFLTTNLAANQKLESIPKYNKYTRTIRNLEKNIEKICGMINLNYYIGNTPVIKLRRRTIIKDVIDLVLIHTKYLKTQAKDRIIKASENYGIHKDLTNLFFFELKDDIFLTSSAEKDYYKLIKFNNIIAYIVLILITELNTGQIMSLKDDKKCNYFLYSKVGKTLFDNLYLRLSENEKISINKIPLLGYIIFYFSCMLCNNNIWLWDKDSNINIYSIQKIFIHTMVDMINTLFEANMNENKDFQYELIVNRLKYKIKNIYNDKLLLKQIETENNKRIKIQDGKISFITKKDKLIHIENIKEEDYNFKNYITNCQSSNYKFNIVNREESLNIYTDMTNCQDGKFHKFSYNKKRDDIVCDLCNKSYMELVKEKNNDSKELTKKLKLLYLYNLGETYCITGEIHERDNNDKCKLCNIDLNNRKYSNSQLYELEKNLDKITEEEYNNHFRRIKKFFKKKAEKEENINNIISQMNERFDKHTQGKIYNYTSNFIDKLIKNIGEKLSHDNKVIYLNKDTFIIKNDYLGNSLNKKITINEEKIKVLFDKFFNKDVIRVHDKINNVSMYYDNITKLYIGYSKNNNYNKIQSNINIDVIYSVKNMILNLGLVNTNYNIDHFINDYTKLSDKEKNKENINIINNILRTRVYNLKQIITNFNNIIEKINYKFKVYNDNTESKIIQESIKTIDEIKLFNKENKNKVFKHLNIIDYLNIEEIDENINYIITNNYINIGFLEKLNNLDIKLIFYLIYNLNRIIEYNQGTKINNIILFLIKVIYYLFNKYYVNYDEFQLRRFDKLLLIDKSYVDESLRVVGYYQELVDINMIDEDNLREMEHENNEEKNSHDIDMYDEDDINEDYDGNDEMISNLVE